MDRESPIMMVDKDSQNISNLYSLFLYAFKDFVFTKNKEILIIKISLPGPLSESLL